MKTKHYVALSLSGILGITALATTQPGLVRDLKDKIVKVTSNLFYAEDSRSSESDELLKPKLEDKEERAPDVGEPSEYENNNQSELERENVSGRGLSEEGNLEKKVLNEPTSEKTGKRSSFYHSDERQEIIKKEHINDGDYFGIWINQGAEMSDVVEALWNGGYLIVVESEPKLKSRDYVTEGFDKNRLNFDVWEMDWTKAKKRELEITYSGNDVKGFAWEELIENDMFGNEERTTVSAYPVVLVEEED